MQQYQEGVVEAPFGDLSTYVSTAPRLGAPARFPALKFYGRLLAGLIGIILVMLFMMIIYRVMGVISCRQRPGRRQRLGPRQPARDGTHRTRGLPGEHRRHGEHLRHARPLRLRGQPHEHAGDLHAARHHPAPSCRDLRGEEKPGRPALLRGGHALPQPHRGGPHQSPRRPGRRAGRRRGAPEERHLHHRLPPKHPHPRFRSPPLQHHRRQAGPQGGRARGAAGPQDRCLGHGKKAQGTGPHQERPAGALQVRRAPGHPRQRP